jgi:hypothetical protein
VVVRACCCGSPATSASRRIGPSAPERVTPLPLRDDLATALTDSHQQRESLNSTCYHLLPACIVYTPSGIATSHFTWTSNADRRDSGRYHPIAGLRRQTQRLATDHHPEVHLTTQLLSTRSHFPAPLPIASRRIHIGASTILPLEVHLGAKHIDKPSFPVARGIWVTSKPSTMADNDRGSNAPAPAPAPATGLSTASNAGAVDNNIASNRFSPPITRTPPSKPTKSTLFFPDTLGNRSHSRNNSEAVDPVALASALKDYDEAGRRRERTPGTSPSRKRQRVYGDRSVYSST